MTDIANFPSGLLDECLAREIDLAVATSAAESFLLALGVSCDSESMAASPRRMAEAYAALLTARPFEMTTFPNEERYDELVVVRSIPVQSVCEHHFLPFTGVVTVGETLAGFADPNIVLIAVLFVLGDGLVRTGVARRLGDWLRPSRCR